MGLGGEGQEAGKNLLTWPQPLTCTPHPLQAPWGLSACLTCRRTWAASTELRLPPVPLTPSSWSRSRKGCGPQNSEGRAEVG